MAFTAEEISDINYYLGWSSRADYISNTTARLLEAIAASQTSENRIRNNLRKIKRLEQKIEEAQNNFGTMAQPGKQMSSGQQLAMLSQEAYRHVCLMAEDAQLMIRHNVFTIPNVGSVTRG